MEQTMGEGGNWNFEGQRLAKFVMDSGRVLELMVEYRRWLLPAYMRDDFDAAWPQARDAIRNTASIIRGEIVAQPLWPSAGPVLFGPDDLHRWFRFFGLTGAQLTLKLGIFYQAYDQVVDNPEFIEAITTTTETDAPVRKKKRRILGGLLNVMNSIFGSISRVVPGIDVAKEFKEMAEHGYRQSEEE